MPYCVWEKRKVVASREEGLGTGDTTLRKQSEAVIKVNGAVCVLGACFLSEAFS